MAIKHEWTTLQRHVLHLARSHYGLDYEPLAAVFDHAIGSQFSDRDFGNGTYLHDEHQNRLKKGKSKMWWQQIDRTSYNATQQAERTQAHALIQASMTALSITANPVTVAPATTSNATNNVLTSAPTTGANIVHNIIPTTLQGNQNTTLAAPSTAAQAVAVSNLPTQPSAMVVSNPSTKSSNKSLPFRLAASQSRSSAQPRSSRKTPSRSLSVQAARKAPSDFSSKAPSESISSSTSTAKQTRKRKIVEDDSEEETEIADPVRARKSRKAPSLGLRSSNRLMMRTHSSDTAEKKVEAAAGTNALIGDGAAAHQPDSATGQVGDDPEGSLSRAASDSTTNPPTTDTSFDGTSTARSSTESTDSRFKWSYIDEMVSDLATWYAPVDPAVFFLDPYSEQTGEQPELESWDAMCARLLAQDIAQSEARE